MSHEIGANAEQPGNLLQAAVERVARLLPAQGPIGVFIHHNTLHAFEDEVFEDAVVRASEFLDCEPYLEEDRYREQLRLGRIHPRDVHAVLDRDVDTASTKQFARVLTRRELRRVVLTHGIPEAHGTQLRWMLTETPVLARFRSDLPGEVREVLFRGQLAGSDPEAEAELVGELWRACLEAVGRAHPTPQAVPAAYRRHRDYLLATSSIDTDDWIHPVLIRFASAYLDQGLAHWQMPGRERGMYGCFIELYGCPLVRLCGPWASYLTRIIADECAHHRDAWESLQNSLNVLGVREDEWAAYLAAEAQALRGWAGMVRQLEERPDRLPVQALPVRLVDFLAVRLLVSRAAATHARHVAGIGGSLAELRGVPGSRLTARHEKGLADRAWPIFHIAQLCAITAATLDDLSTSEVHDLEAELGAFRSVERRRLLHQAYERHLRHRIYDALAQHPVPSSPASPAYQVLFCLDEREESMRRHLEEVEPEVETLGTAGFYGVAMYFRSATDAHARPLCPVAVTPQHYVAEVEDEQPARMKRWRLARQRLMGLIDKNIHVGSRTFSRGAVIMATLGVLWLVPLVFHVLFPWSRRGLALVNALLFSRRSPRLRLERSAEKPPLGQHAGFTVDEMADIVHGQLTQIGIADRLAPLVVVLGHGSASLNNPQESAHDCGACGGGRGGPNARALAQMANDRRVRERLVNLGMHISLGTWFVGGQRNTANNDVVLYDEDLVPESTRPLLERAKGAFETARQREAQERCRRFETASTRLSPRAALLHVQGRAVDLAQPRPEYGHASNAMCVIGRRDRTRGLFLDRRAFLASYDPSRDPEGEVLKRVLSAVLPVVAGINLEYFFGYVDPTGYGCGTKLPHNVTSLLGVMDGAQSDLRTGLPWQMLEIHEPVRLTLVVETTVERLLAILEQNPVIRRLVHNRWIALAALDPGGNRISEIAAEGVRRYCPEQPLRTVMAPSLTHYRAQRGHLPFVRLEAAAAPGGDAP